MPERREITIRGEMIRLGQLLKLAGVIDSGGEFHELIDTTGVRVNGADETRRGRQLHAGDVVEVSDAVLVVAKTP